MYSLKKIFLILLLLVGCFGMADAQKKAKKKANTQKTASKSKTKQKAKAKKAKKSSTKNKATTDAPKKITRKISEGDIATASLNREALSDTSNPKEVLITSAFKPSLKNAAKINFTAATPLQDTTKLILNYRVPSQNLFFSYQPVPIKPIALFVDSGYTWQNQHFIKLGFGNFSTPFAAAGFSFGDGENAIVNINAQHVSSKGNLPFQQFSKTNIDVLSIFNTASNHEWTAKAFYNTSTQYLYGFQPSTIAYNKDDLLQQFHTVGLELGMQNKQATSFGFSYHPQLQVNYFTDNIKSQEINLVAKLPFSKTIGKIYGFNMGLTADIAAVNTPMIPNPLKFDNNLIYIDPTVTFNTPNVKLNLGVLPSWDNQVFAMLPNLTAEAKITENGLSVQVGWIGYYQKNSYRSLASFNPWLAHLSSNILNTKIAEQYIGLKGAAGNHLTYQARLSLMQLNNQPLFVNNFTDGRSFNILYDSKIQALRLHAEAGYQIQEKFSFIGSLNLTEYTSLTNYDKAYGLIPMEVTGTFKWKILKDVQIKADAFLRDGSTYQNKLLQSQKLAPAADINLGAEFSVLPKLNFWLQMNNLLNNKYQRWNQYEVLGFNVLGGVVYSFK